MTDAASRPRQPPSAGNRLHVRTRVDSRCRRGCVAGCHGYWKSRASKALSSNVAATRKTDAIKERTAHASTNCSVGCPQDLDSPTRTRNELPRAVAHIPTGDYHDPPGRTETPTRQPPTNLHNPSRPRTHVSPAEPARSAQDAPYQYKNRLATQPGARVTYDHPLSLEKTALLTVWG